MENLIHPELELAWAIFKLMVAWVLSFTTVYTILSLALKGKRRMMSATVSTCLSVFCFEGMAEILNHWGEYVAFVSLGIFLFALVYEAYKRK